MEDFVKNVDTEDWKSVLSIYSKTLNAKAAKMKPEKKRDLIKLDKWYQSELPGIIKQRKPKHVTKEELCQLMKWKLTRGKFRPRLTELVQTNTEEEVTDASTQAFQKLPDVAAAVQALTVLKAVGPATASAILAAGAPEHAAFMADESMLALPGLQPIKYDLPFYKEYMKKINAFVKELNKQDTDKSWTPHSVELTLWTYYIAKTMDPSLLQAVEKSKRNNNNSEPAAKKQKT